MPPEQVPGVKLEGNFPIWTGIGNVEEAGRATRFCKQKEKKAN